MSKKSSADRSMFIIGILVIGVLVWQFGGYLLPDKTPAKTGETFLIEVMEASGGKENYENIQRITFKKAFHLYREDGSIEIDRKEIHSYDFTNGSNQLIQWKSENAVYNLIANNTSIFRTKNGIKDTTITRGELMEQLYASTFVLGLPYKLDIPNCLNTYAGIRDFEGTQAHTLVSTFQESRHGWYFYFDINNLDWLGYWVQTEDHYSLVINEEMTEVNGFKFPRKRKSYRTDAQKNRLYLRADYEYSNFVID